MKTTLFLFIGICFSTGCSELSKVLKGDSRSDDTSSVPCTIVSLDRSYVQQQLGPEYREIITKARITPISINQEVAGFRYTAIDQTSLIAKLCFQNDDVLTSVNEKKMDQPQYGFVLYDELNTASVVKIEILRGGEPKSIIVNIQ